jgi:hypothetical protein
MLQSNKNNITLCVMICPCLSLDAPEWINMPNLETIFTIYNLKHFEYLDDRISLVIVLFVYFYL